MIMYSAIIRCNNKVAFFVLVCSPFRFCNSFVQHGGPGLNGPHARSRVAEVEERATGSATLVKLVWPDAWTPPLKQHLAMSK